MNSFSQRRNGETRKIQLVLVGLTFIFAWIISGWNTYNTDLQNYEIRFSVADFGDLVDANFGFSFFYAVLKYLGLDFFHSRLVLYGIFYSLLAYVLFKSCKNACLAFILYLGFQLVRDTVEMKNFMALVTTLFSIYVLSFQTLKHRFISLILILIAGSFHISYYAYLLIPLIPFQKKLPFFPLLLVYVAASFFSKLIVGNVLSIYTTAFIDERVDDLMRYTGYGAFFASLLVVCGCATVFYLTNKKVERLNNFDSIEVNSISYRQYSLFVYNINVVGASLLVLASITFSFICRVYAVIIVLNIIYCLNYFYYRKRNRFDLTTILFVFFYMAVLTYLTMSKMHHDDVFNNNLIFN